MRASSNSCRPWWSSTRRRFRPSGRRSRSTRATSRRCRPRRSRTSNLLDISDMLLPQPRLRQHQRQPGQPLAERPHLPRLPGLAAGGQPHRPVDVPGRHALQRRLRGDDQLGSDSPVGHRGHRHHPRLQPDLRAEHPRGSAGRAHQARLRLPRAPSSRRGGARSGGGPSTGSTADSAARSTGISTFNVLNDDGWREQSPSDLNQVFAKVGYRTEPHRRRGELHVRRQRPHRQRPGAGEPAGAGPQGRVHVPRQDRRT